MKVERYDIRTSSRRTFRRCLRKWGFQSSIRMGLKRRGAESNINFWFGSAIHFAMEDYFGYNKFGDPRRAYKAYYESFKVQDRPEGADQHYDLGLAMLTYFLEWYPKHNNDLGFKTLWFNEDDQAVPEWSEGARPAVEEEFLLDLGYRVLVDESTGKIIKEWVPETDVLCHVDGFNADFSINKPVKTSEVCIGEECPGYYFLHQDIKQIDKVKVVPICYHGTMDRLVVDKYGRWWILDYKTAKRQDTKKLDTDDQISAYMWAAEQRFQHPFYGFVYLQLTKDVAKPPKRLKSGALSVDKKQVTTYHLFKDEVIGDYGTVAKAPNVIIEMLNHLASMEEPEGDRFIRWDFVTRNDNQKRTTYENIMAEAYLMIDTKLRLFPNPTRDCSWDCNFKQICIAMDRGDPVEEMINLEFETRDDTLEHNDDDWKKNIKWPETPLEAAALDDVDLKPANIFNIILPDEYYSNDYEGE